MDNFHNYHHQWRHGSPQASSTCPVCSAPHFPFCPTYPPCNPQIPNPNPPYPHQFPRPGFGPFLHHHQRPHPHSPFVDPLNAIGYQGVGYDGGPEGTDRSLKRPRIDYLGSDHWNPKMSENERRLRLIRDHGGRGSLLMTSRPPGNPRTYNFEQPPVPGSVDRKRPFLEQGSHYTNDHRNEFQYNGQTSPQSLLLRGEYAGDPSGQIQPQSPTPIHRPSLDFASHSVPPNRSISLFPMPGNSSIVTCNSTCPPISHASMVPSGQTAVGGQSFQQKSLSDKPKVVDASQMFMQPHRATRPDHFVIILRGLPGSGKSYVAKMLRDIEVENGGSAPRIHAMDDYFMTEVEQVEENDASTPSTIGRSKRPVVKKVMQYCYEPEMEEAYRSSMLKAFKRTLEEGAFTFVIEVWL